MSMLVLLLALFALIVIATFLYRRNRLAKEKPEYTLLVLEQDRQRLQVIMSKLLTRVDELDQQQKYSGCSVSQDWQARMASTCADLAALGDIVSNIEQLIKAKNIERARSSLSESCDLAAHLMRKLKETESATLCGVKVRTRIDA